MAPIPRLRAYEGPALLSYGFRPFFLFGAIYAGAAVLVWLPMLHGEISLTTAFAPRDWHVHEMLFGYVAAVVTGFLLTAVPNWTGRLPLQGTPLLALVLIWAAGRLAVTFSAWLGWLVSAAIDAAFLLAVAAAIAREIVVGRNWRNLKVVAIVSVLAASNIAFHIEAWLRGSADYAARLGIGVVVLLVVLIGGRIVPSFTRNWLARQSPGRLPAPFGRLDLIVIAASFVALTGWVILPFGAATGAALLVACVLQAARLARWAGHRTAGEPLVIILHIGYAFIPIGFLLAGAAAFEAVPASAGVHSWASGAIGTMTLAVMSRASLGHTGRQLEASAATQLIYALVIVAACARIGAALGGTWSGPLLEIAAFAWAGAFIGFAIVYGPVLWRRSSEAGALAMKRDLQSSRLLLTCVRKRWRFVRRALLVRHGPTLSGGLAGWLQACLDRPAPAMGEVLGWSGPLPISPIRGETNGGACSFLRSGINASVGALYESIARVVRVWLTKG